MLWQIHSKTRTISRSEVVMAEAYLLYPQGTIWRTSTKQVIMDALRECISEHMNGTDYEGFGLGLTPQRVEVLLQAYSRDDAGLGSLFVLRISGHDYPRRMANIRGKLTNILEDFERLLRTHPLDMNPSDYKALQKATGGGLATVTYLPYPSGCRVSSAREA